jgi:hypothetical protein
MDERWRMPLLAVTMVWLMLLQPAQVKGYHFPLGYAHSYTYIATNNVMGQNNVTTVLKA